MDGRKTKQTIPLQEELDAFLKHAELFKHHVFHQSQIPSPGLEYKKAIEPILDKANQLTEKLHEGLLAIYQNELNPSTKPKLFQANAVLHANKLKLARMLGSVTQKQIATIPQVIFLYKLIEKCEQFNTRLDPAKKRFGKLMDDSKTELSELKGMVFELIENAEKDAESRLKLLDYKDDILFEQSHHPVFALKNSSHIDIGSAGLSDILFYPNAMTALRLKADICEQYLYGPNQAPGSLDIQSYSNKRMDADFLRALYELLDKPHLMMQSPEDKIAFFAVREQVRRFLDKLESKTKKLLLKFVEADKRAIDDVANRSAVQIEGQADRRKEDYASQDKDANPFQIKPLEDDIKLGIDQSLNVDKLIANLTVILEEYRKNIYVEVPPDQTQSDKSLRALKWHDDMYQANPHIPHGQLTMFGKWKKVFAELQEALLSDIDRIKALSNGDSSEKTIDQDQRLLPLVEHAKAMLASLKLLELKAAGQNIFNSLPKI